MSNNGSAPPSRNNSKTGINATYLTGNAQASGSPPTSSQDNFKKPAPPPRPSRPSDVPQGNTTPPQTTKDNNGNTTNAANPAQQPKKEKKEKKPRVKNNLQISAPLPDEFMRDPKGKITITEVSEWFNVTFEYDAVLRCSEWSKPDKEGELMKQGFYMKKNMKPRHCFVQGSKFFVFKQKPTNDEDEPALSIDMRNGSVTPQGIQSKFYCFEIAEADQQLGKKVFLGAKSKPEYDSWIEKLQAAITYDGPVVEIIKPLKQSITVQFSTEYGYVGFPVEWKHFLRDHSIAEKQFFEKPMEVINQVRFGGTSSTPIVAHQASSAPVTIEDVINKKGSPDMYIGYQLLGSGSFGEVYEAVDVTTNKKVAIKKMLVTPRRLKLFISEINIQRSTEHPNVVKFFDAFPVDTHIWVVLEYMANGNLTMVLDALKESKQNMVEPQIAYICTETLKALSYIHTLHRIHRDIKSDNVLGRE